MIDKFLKAKHWQLFCLMFGLPMIFQIIIMGSMFSNITSETNINPTELFGIMKYFPIIMFIYIGLIFGWFWSIAIGLQNKVPKNIKLKTKTFKLFFFIPLIYITLISLFIGNMFSGFIGTEPNAETFNGMIGIVVIIVPLHLLSMFGMLHSMYFVAKTFKTVELQKEVEFGDFAGEFFMLWFYPVGIWIIQPKVNKIVAEDTKL